MSCQMPMVQQRKSDCKCCAKQPVEVSTGTRPLCLRIWKFRCFELTLTFVLVLLGFHAAVHLYLYQFKGKNNNPNPTPDSSWKNFGQSSYRFYEEALLFEDARANCMSNGGDLAIIKSQQVNSFLVEITSTSTPTGCYWLGLTRNNDSNFVWLDGTLERRSKSSWNSGEPNDAEDGEDCACMYVYRDEINERHGKWNDVSCPHQLPYICERPKALPCLSTQPQVKIVTTSTIKIGWEGAYEGDGSVCGFVVELKTPTSTSWTRVGFVAFNENVGDFEYTIGRLYAGAVYQISVIILNCSGREGERGPEISQSTEDREPWVELPSVSTSTAPPCQAQNCAECVRHPTKNDDFWRKMVVTAVPVPLVIVLFQLIILIRCCVNRSRGELYQKV